MRRIALLAALIALITSAGYTQFGDSVVRDAITPEQAKEKADKNFFETVVAAPDSEKKSLKADRIVQELQPGVYQDTKHGFTITLESIEKVENGVALYASATRDGKKVGFVDGTVEIEHFIFINPPVMLDDPLGKIIVDTVDFDGTIKQRKLSLDAKKAIIDSLAHTISIVAKDDTKIVLGKRGNTTTTVYATKDEILRRGVDVNQTWANIRAGAGTGHIDAACGPNVLGDTTSNQWDVLDRCGYIFDTSSIPDTENIDSATFSLYGVALYNGVTGMSINVGSFTPASDSTFANSDYGTFGTTKFTTDLAVSSWATAAYNDFALNASGLAVISKTGNSRFGFMFTEDMTNTAPTWVSAAQTLPQARDSSAAGTTEDPKLVVVSSAAAAGGTKSIISDVVIFD